MCLKTDSDRPSKIFLERSGPRAINSEGLRPPKPDCGVCSAVQGGLSVGPSATLKDLVEGVLQGELGYNTGELSIRINEGVIYEPDMDDNLPRKLSELGIKSDTFLTVIDDDDFENDPRVNLELRIVQRFVHVYLPLLTSSSQILTVNARIDEPPEDSKPVKLEQTLDIPRAPKESVMPGPVNGKRKREDEGEPMTNGHVDKKIAGESSQKDDENIVVMDDDNVTKKIAGKPAQKGDEDIVVIDDDEDQGAILIDD